MKNTPAAFAMCSTVLASIASTAAYANHVTPPMPNPANADTMAAMQSQCDALAAMHDTGDGDIWSGVVVPGVVTLTAGPTEVPGTRVIDMSTLVGVGFHPSGLYIDGDPYRNGGSVNMFGEQRATAAYYDSSTYYYDADFDTTFSFAFMCNIFQEDYHPPVHHDAEGMYVVRPSEHGNDDATEQACRALNGIGPTWPHWGQDTQQCLYQETSPAYDDPEYWDPAMLVSTEAGMPVDQIQTDNLRAFEANGGGFEISGDIFVGQVVVCISPSTATKKGVPGEWRPQNGYSGEKCNTAYYNVAPQGHGTRPTTATYISVPAT